MYEISELEGQIPKIPVFFYRIVHDIPGSSKGFPSIERGDEFIKLLCLD